MSAHALPRRNKLVTIDNQARERLAALRVQIAAREQEIRSLRERLSDPQRSYSTGTQREILAASEALIRELRAECGQLTRQN